MGSERMKEVNLQTNRLVIRTYRLTDEEKIYPVINDPKIYETTLHIPYPYPKNQIAVWLHFTRKNCEYKKGYECGIFLGEHYIGNVGIVNVDLMNNQAEISYFIGSAYWGCGYATEAVEAMLIFGFEQLGLERILGRSMLHNEASKRVLTKCGFIYEGIGRHEVMKEGRFLDVYRSSILQSDYLARH